MDLVLTDELFCSTNQTLLKVQNVLFISPENNLTAFILELKS